jgi:fructokinase
MTCVNNMSSRVVAIEGGGTKFVLSIGNDVATATRHVIPTTTPEETMRSIKGVIAREHDELPVTAIGVATFGPIDIDRQSPSYGEVGVTPKQGWQGYNFVTDLGLSFGLPVLVDSDVNAAALAEASVESRTQEMVNGEDPCRHLVYVTVGTGIGVGVVHSGAIANGFMHPEIGHIAVPRHPQDREFKGACPYHADCIEGLASGPSVIKRWGQSLSELGSDHFGHDLEAFYLGQLCATLILNHMPTRIVLGGGVSKTPGLIQRVRGQCRLLLNGYLPSVDTDEALERLIVRPVLGEHSGISGAYILANRALS